MKTKILFLILAALVLMSPNMIFAQYDDTIFYLQSQNQNAWITQALVAGQISNPDISYIDEDTDDLMAASKNLLSLTAIASQDIDSLNSLVNTIESNINNGQVGSEDLLNDDFWALMALESVSKTDHIDTIKNFILAHQNSDGGWSWSTSGDSDSNDTAAAIMALLDAGLNSSSPEIINALAYLQILQNEDGGIGYDSASQSDGASSAWLISALNKVGIDGTSWQIGENNPQTFLEGLHQEDGSFLWLPSDNQGSAMVTAYALVALSNKSYPVNYIQIPTNEPAISGHDIRIEGPNDTICLASNLEADTVLDLLEVASDVCNFEYTTQDSDYGVYVSAIDGLAAQGMDGWQYFVNNQAGAVAVADYHFTGNESILWGYGGWPLYASQIEISDNNIDVGGQATIQTKYFDGNSWQVWPQAPIHIGSNIFETDSAGQFQLSMPLDGVYSIWADYDSQRIRSNKVYLTVGNGVSQTVDLSVNIESNSGGGGNNGVNDTIAFAVDQSNINFGDLHPGQSSETILNLSNTGSTDIYIEASIIGEDIFSNYTSLNSNNWTDYNISLPSFQNQSVNVNLSVPSDYSSTGQKTGQLIFWAINQ